MERLSGNGSEEFFYVVDNLEATREVIAEASLTCDTNDWVFDPVSA